MSALNFDDYALVLHPRDNVAFVKQPLKAGAELVKGTMHLRAASAIPLGHKIALTQIADDQPVYKYGQIIGFARGSISPGEHVHVHNLAMKEFGREYQFGTEVKPMHLYSSAQMRCFQGYQRADGRVGTRNYLAVISSVNCSASVSRYIAEKFRSPELQRDFPNVDGVVAFTHKGGCGLPLDNTLVILQRVLAGMARHPNISGYVLVGLGCEINQIQFLLQDYKLNETRPGEPAPTVLTIQNVGGVRNTVEAGVAAVTRLLPIAQSMRRSSQPVSKLTLALNCGGSDGYSGLTANPALGVAADELVRYGGTPVLAETPEIYGAEHLLTRRAVSREVGEKLLGIIRWWEEHARVHHASIDNNPSYGNRAAGLTTIYEKSLGAICKGGQAPLTNVYHYAEQIKGPGLCFMDTPGYDPVSMTGLVSGGCNLGVFTTGLGSVYGCKPTPCLKVATNTRIFEQMNDDMDLNAGTILDGVETVAQVGGRIFEKMLAVASGEKTKSELAGIGDEEFAPWNPGPTF